LATAARVLLKAPVHAYRWTLKPWLGWECRHLPTCSEYALEAIELNGAWRGGWLTLARLCRCHPWGSHGYDPPPDIRHEVHRLAPWRYGRWHLDTDAPAQAAGRPCSRPRP
jgi:putative membrane protein insertion efficiency factor